MGAAPAPEVFTLVPPDQGPGPPSRSLEAWQRQGRFPRGRGVWDWPDGPPPDAPPAGRLVFRRSPDGRVTVDGFPEEADVCEPLVARLDPAGGAPGARAALRRGGQRRGGVRPGGPLPAAGLHPLRPRVPAPGRPLSRGLGRPRPLPREGEGHPGAGVTAPAAQRARGTGWALAGPGSGGLPWAWCRWRCGRGRGTPCCTHGPADGARPCRPRDRGTYCPSPRMRRVASRRGTG